MDALTLLRVLCLCFVLCGGVHSGGARAAENASAPDGPLPAKDQGDTQNRKLRIEIEKLEQEVRGLRDTNEVLGTATRRWSTWLGALGGLLGAVIALGSAALLGLKLNTTQNRKLEQERVLGREKHNMELFQNLGHASVRVQLAAAAVLTQRLESFRSEPELGPAEHLEKHTIIQVLLAVTKKSDEAVTDAAPRADPIFLKLIGDNLVKAMGAIKADDWKESGESALKGFDFQKVQFPDAYWRRVDARKIDFFGANLSHASLGYAFLEEAVLQEADLRSSVLREADLRQADLRRANLSGAKLEGAKLDGAKVAGAVATGARYAANPAGRVDVSPEGNGSRMVSVGEWLAAGGAKEIGPPTA